ncbi:DUF3791 domain-containing protein [Pseudobutyrivibrio ruminis]|uniref:DUF3791 domain-containing protein n=1 Tax=Pseudobutyrivibrio ruminis TaxID=46206 RepID=UPI000419B8B5|nr:DUF3791 domain-containing protein [Pseudobutyrivibrio ruminis]
MGLNKRDDIFMLQVRLFRLAQLKWNKSAEECEQIFKKYGLNEYIETCYEEYHVQGDEANLADLEHYLKVKGLSI